MLLDLQVGHNHVLCSSSKLNICFSGKLITKVGLKLSKLVSSLTLVARRTIVNRVWVVADVQWAALRTITYVSVQRNKSSAEKIEVFQRNNCCLNCLQEGHSIMSYTSEWMCIVHSTALNTGPDCSFLSNNSLKLFLGRF